MKVKNLILGAGIAGLAYANELRDEDTKIFEKTDHYGGLCHSFQINGFTFDSAVHLSFTENTAARKQFDKTPYITHLPLAYNFYKGYWLKHPVVNNFFQLEAGEKVQLLKSFINCKTDQPINNYKDWLLASYGEEISKHFYEVYTKKYWTVKAEALSTSWIGKRLESPNLEKMLWGAFSSETGMDYYAKEMRYPIIGGYQAFIDDLAEQKPSKYMSVGGGSSDHINITYNKEAIHINLAEKIVCFQDGTVCHYDKLASSIPLPKLANITDGIPADIQKAASYLKASKISLVSIGFNKEDIPKSIWFYIYDEDILAARANSPSMKSKNNAPAGCSSLQFEIYHAQDTIVEKDVIIENTKAALTKMQLCKEEDILFMDYRLLEYGNVIFENEMEKQRDKVRKYFEHQDVDLIGRFGEWEYYWSDQSYISGKCKGIKQRTNSKYKYY